MVTFDWAKAGTARGPETVSAISFLLMQIFLVD